MVYSQILKVTNIIWVPLLKGSNQKKIKISVSLANKANFKCQNKKEKQGSRCNFMVVLKKKMMMRLARLGRTN